MLSVGPKIQPSMRIVGIFFLILFLSLPLYAQERRFVRVNLCGMYDESWKGRLSEDKKCLITEIVCQRSGNQFVAGTVSTLLEFESFQSQIDEIKKNWPVQRVTRRVVNLKLL